MIEGFRCAVCGATVQTTDPLVFTCPNRTTDDPHHVLHLVTGGRERAAGDDPNPLLRYGERCAWRAFALGNGLTEADCDALVADVGDDFRVTPFGRSAALSDELGLDIWVKDETGNVTGSHKARHLVGIMLHLLAAERLGLLSGRPPLAIASCGNAALAAATLAARVGWPIDVYVPTWMDDAFGRRLDALDARTHRCERQAADPSGDPSMLRFREAVTNGGAIPFTVQGPENALCLDTGRTIGWEIADQAAEVGIELDRVVVQVGGGAFAACLGAGVGPSVRLDTVQAEGCAPFAAAWARAAAIPHPEREWSSIMTPWPHPHSAADGILDDETYDWLAVRAVMSASGGIPIVATEAEILRANELAVGAGFEVSATGSSGLAGILHAGDQLEPGDRVAVVMSGVARS